MDTRNSIMTPGPVVIDIENITTEYFMGEELVWSFFFSSRRRHTRSTRDWSSDVCSSDLELVIPFVAGARGAATGGALALTKGMTSSWTNRPSGPVTHSSSGEGKSSTNRTMSRDRKSVV